jgi:predicted Zn-dependent protease
MQAAQLLDSDPPAAAREAAEILKEHPGHAAATLLLGTALRHSGDHSRATAAFAQFASAQPDSPLARLELGRTLASQGRSLEAMVAFQHAVQTEPNFADAWREIAALHATRGDPIACDRAYANFVRLAQPERHLAEAGAALANKRFAAASELLQRRLAEDPQDVAAMCMLAEVEAECEDFVAAERWLGECLTLAPGYALARFSLARILYAQQKAAPMLPLLERLLATEPESLRYLALQASAYGLLGQNERAAQLLSALMAEHPSNETLVLSYGHSMRTAGELSEAIAAYRKSTALRPTCGEAWFCLANLKTFRFTAQDLDTMRGQLAREDLNDEDRLHFEFAMGKGLEDAGQFAESFAHYARGNAVRRAAVRYDGGANTRLVQRTQQLYTREFLAARAGAGCHSQDPIFIIGLPRSGSTLLEQILASHSQVEGTRELPDVPGFALELGARETPGQPPRYPQAVADLTRSDLLELGERYLAQTRPSRLHGRPRFIDKMPSNFFHIGLIHLMLPNARIIDARRSAMGCCFSNFKQHFQAGVWFTYNLTDLGHYYRDYVELMAHFDAVLPGRVHRVHYEKLVGDLEGETRRLLDYCGLPFEEQCLRFHETRRVVQTASSEQVRQPLYAEGVDQWRHFEPWLQELKDALGDLAQS